MTGLRDELETYAGELEVDLFGVADLTSARDFILRQGGMPLADFPRGISLAMRLLDAVVDELHRHKEPSVIYTYRGLYNSVNANLDRAALLIAKRLQKEGYRAYAIPASQTIDERRLVGAISHKLVAHLAGLGWIGKSCLLITPQYGPRVRLASILTNAPLEPGEPIPNECGECHNCVDICPPKAITGMPFNPSEPRDVRFRAQLCRDYFRRRAQLLGEGICGLCVYVCPYGRRGADPQSIAFLSVSR
jgi:epoxyqueuosine reductase QueG